VKLKVTLFGPFIGLAVTFMPVKAACAQRSSSSPALNRQSLQNLSPNEVARRVLGAVAGNVRSVDVDDLNRVGGPLGSVTLTFQPHAMSAGICFQRLLTVFFTAIDPEQTFGRNPETVPVRAVDFRTEERFRVTGPTETVPTLAARNSAADQACEASNDDDLYFSVDGIGPLDLAVQAMERALVDLRSVADARSLIGRLAHVDMHDCASRELNCMRVTARISEHGYRLDPEGYNLTVDEVRYDRSQHLVSIGHHELVQRMIITH
jgi:hypothetical protein